MPINLNNADEQQDLEYSLIPKDTIVKLNMTIRPGGLGDDNLLTQSKADPNNKYLDCEFVVIEGKYDKWRLWQIFVVEGSEKACNISKSILRAIVESWKNIHPQDGSESAYKKRVVEYSDFDKAEFTAKIGIKKKEGFKDSNYISKIITPDMPEYSQAGAKASVKKQTKDVPFWEEPVMGTVPEFASNDDIPF
jgi:hypothetical protein